MEFYTYLLDFYPKNRGGQTASLGARSITTALTYPSQDMAKDIIVSLSCTWNTIFALYP